MGGLRVADVGVAVIGTTTITEPNADTVGQSP